MAHSIYGLLVKYPCKLHQSVWVIEWKWSVEAWLGSADNDPPCELRKYHINPFWVLELWQLSLALNKDFFSYKGYFFWRANKGLILYHHMEANYYLHRGSTICVVPQKLVPCFRVCNIMFESAFYELVWVSGWLCQRLCILASSILSRSSQNS